MRVQVAAPRGIELEEVLEKSLKSVQHKHERKFHDHSLAAKQAIMDKHLKRIFSNMISEIGEVLRNQN